MVPTRLPKDLPANLTTLPDQAMTVHLEALTGRACFTVDADQNITTFGPMAEELTGFSAAEALGRHCLATIRCPSCLGGCGLFRVGNVRGKELVLHDKDGRVVSIRKSGIVIRDGSGDPQGALEMIWPVEEASAASPRTALDNILGALGRWFVAADAELKVVQFSGGLPEFLGHTEARLTGMPMAELLGEELFGDGSPFRVALDKGERREGWYGLLHTAGGDTLPVSLTAARLDRDRAESGTAGCDTEASLLVMIRLQDEVAADSVVEEAPPSFCGIVGRSPPMQRIFRLIDQIQDNDATVLVTGESGTGKELVAHAIHMRSHRRDGPFVAVNCGALPDALLESELFGHVKGAFTGAIRDKRGRFELAQGGTLFLDEIGDLPLPLQVKLLRVLQEHSFERVGDNRTRELDVRIVAATHVDLAVAVAERSFRDDLFYRLRVVPIELPPLRDRSGDLELLIRFMARKIGKERGRSLHIAPSSMRALLSHDWPGNVRELENAIEYATAVCEGQTIHLGDLPVEIGAEGRAVAPMTLLAPRPLRARHASDLLGSPPAPVPAEFSAEQAVEARRIVAALEATRYHRERAAEQLGISRSTLWRKMKEYRID